MLPPDPSDQMETNSPIEDDVFNEVWYHGGTIHSIRNALKSRGRVYSVKQIEATLRGWQKRKWIHRHQGEWSLTQAAINYMR